MGRIVSGSHDKTIRVWNIKTNSPWSVMTLTGHSGEVRCLHLEVKITHFIWNIVVAHQSHQCLTNVQMLLQTRVSTGRPVVPLSWDKGRRKCPRTNSSVPGHPGTKWIKKIQKDFLFQNNVFCVRTSFICFRTSFSALSRPGPWQDF